MPIKTDPTDFGAFLDRQVKSDPALARSVEIAESDLCIAEEIYKQRSARQLSQTQLAKAIGTTQSVIARLEDADYDGYSVRILQRIAVALNVKLEVRLVNPCETTSFVFSTSSSESCSAWPTFVPTEID